MRRLIWAAEARGEFKEVIRYIAADRPQAALDVARRIEAAADGLAAMPTGRRGRITGTYEKVVTGLPYILAYNIHDQTGTLRILHLIHGARDWPDGGWPD